MLPQDAVAGMPVQNKAIPDDNGIQQPPFVANVLLKLLFFFKIQGRDLALKLRVDFKRILYLCKIYDTLILFLDRKKRIGVCYYGFTASQTERLFR